MRIISDAMLAIAVRMPCAALRRAAARRAALRARHEIALLDGADDPFVLAVLGMHAAARSAQASDRDGRFGRILADAAFGKAPDASEMPSLDPQWRRRIASAIAPLDPRKAAEILPVEDIAARAACLHALGDPSAVDVLADCAGREADALRTAFAIDRGDLPTARRLFNRLFEADGLAAPLADTEAPLSIHALGGMAAATAGPLVSIVMPVHDGATTLAMAVGSLLCQSWRAIEILVIDDRSTDASAAIARTLMAADARVRLLANAGPPGVAGARNTGIAAARGRWIAFLDADDWAHPERIARQIAALSSGVATVSHHVRIDEAGRPVAPRVFPLVRICPISMLIETDALRRAGPFEIARTGSDTEMLARLDILYGRAAIARDRSVLTVQSWRANSLSSDPASGMFAADRFAYREDWMRRHVGLARLPSAVTAP